MTMLELGLLALVLPLAALTTVELTLRRTVVGVGLATALYITLLLVDLPALSVGVTIFPNDLIYGLLLVAGGFRLLRSGRVTWQQGALLILLVVGMGSVLRGIPEFGLNSAMNEARKFVYFTGGALYVSTLEPRRELLDRIALMWVLLAGVLVVSGLLRIAGVLPGGGEGFASQGRPLDSNQTLIIAQGGFIALSALRQGMGRLPGYLAPIFLAMVVLMRHRTVWVVVILALVVYVATHMDVARRLFGLLATGALITSVLIVTVFDTGETKVTEQLARSASYVDTLDWRLEGWASLLAEREAGAADLAFGEPFGSGWSRQVDGQEVDVSPHNWYVETYLRTGMVGLGALLILVGGAAVALRHDDGRSGLLPNRALLVLLATQAVYFLAYDPRHVQGLMFGLFLCAMTTGRARRMQTQEAGV